jgi:hypothetical protein
MANKVYTASWQEVINAGISFASNFSIQSVGREIKIRSIFLSWSILDTVTGLQVPWRVSGGHQMLLTLANTGPLIGNAFRIIGGGGPYAQGNIIRITEPGQILFDAFYVANEVLITLQLNNLSAVICQHDVTLIIETEEKTMFP